MSGRQDGWDGLIGMAKPEEDVWLVYQFLWDESEMGSISYRTIISCCLLPLPLLSQGEVGASFGWICYYYSQRSLLCSPSLSLFSLSSFFCLLFKQHKVGKYKSNVMSVTERRARWPTLLKCERRVCRTLLLFVNKKEKKEKEQEYEFKAVLAER